MTVRVSLKTVGCRLNQAETAQIAAQFADAGCEVVPFPTSCDICVVHTCAVTHNAERTCLRISRSLKRLPTPPVVVLAGCLVETCDPQQLRAASGADLLAGQKGKRQLPELVAPLLSPHLRRRLGLSGPEQRRRPVPLSSATRALVKVQDGCDFHCTYCIVPAARGVPRSRPFSHVIDEVRRMTDAGYKEVVLTGANLGTYRQGTKRLVDLLAAIEAIPAVRRMRVSSIEISTGERAVVDYMAQSAKLCPYLHFPAQSGDDGILRNMGRKYRSGEFRRLVEYAASHIQRLGIGTDIIVGFPGEDQRAFQNTVSLVQDLPFSNLHVFPYSARSGTAAEMLPGRVSATVKKRRAARIMRLGDAKRISFARSFVGREVDVLLEHVSGASASGWTGEYLQAVVDSPGLSDNVIHRGEVANVKGSTLFCLA